MERILLQGVLVDFDRGIQNHPKVQMGHSQVFQQVGQANYKYVHQDHKLNQTHRVFVLEFQKHISHMKAHIRPEQQDTPQNDMDILQHFESLYCRLLFLHSWQPSYMNNDYKPRLQELSWCRIADHSHKFHELMYHWHTKKTLILFS